MSENLKWDDLIKSDETFDNEVLNFTGIPAVFFIGQANVEEYELLDPSPLADPEFMRRVALEMFNDSEFRPESVTEYSKQCYRLLWHDEQPTFAFDPRPYTADDIRTITGFRQLGVLPGSGLKSAKYMKRQDLIDVIQSHIPQTLRRGVARGVLNLNDVIPTPVKPTDAFPGQLLFSRRVNAAIVGSLRRKGTTIKIYWLREFNDGEAEMNLQEFGLRFADMQLIPHSCRRDFEYRGHEYIGSDLYGDQFKDSPSKWGEYDETEVLKDE